MQDEPALREYVLRAGRPLSTGPSWDWARAPAIRLLLSSECLLFPHLTVLPSPSAPLLYSFCPFPFSFLLPLSPSSPSSSSPTSSSPLSSSSFSSSGALTFPYCLIPVENAHYIGQIHPLVHQHLLITKCEPWATDVGRGNEREDTVRGTKPSPWLGAQVAKVRFTQVNNSKTSCQQPTTGPREGEKGAACTHMEERQREGVGNGRGGCQGEAGPPVPQKRNLSYPRDA